MKDRQEAVKWYRTAGSPLADMIEESERGSSERKFALSAVLDETAENNEDLAEAFQMCREAAECGYSPAAAALGKMYEWGNDAREKRELITAIYLYVYLKRDKEEQK